MSAEGEKKVLLAVDDVSMNLMIIRDTLSPSFSVRVAKSGKLALQILGSVAVDLILLDIEMPEMSGFEFMDAMRNSSYAKDIPIICVTSHTDEAVIGKALQAGARDVIVKPFTPITLKEKIFGALNMPIDMI